MLVVHLAPARHKISTLSSKICTDFERFLMSVGCASKYDVLSQWLPSDGPSIQSSSFLVLSLSRPFCISVESVPAIPRPSLYAEPVAGRFVLGLLARYGTEAGYQGAKAVVVVVVVALVLLLLLPSRHMKFVCRLDQGSGKRRDKDHTAVAEILQWHDHRIVDRRVLMS